ncbi:cuticle protein 14-like [Tachypleus tridentatus]|uniref:cuticle protein 14-like n=1 Tax=Tachypleus tridentatus TaxID=6853 RepID=UPI003FCFCB01
MKVLIVCALLAVAQAGVFYSPSTFNTGASVQYRSQDSLGTYNFGYDEGHLAGGTFRRESGDGYGNKVGSYGLKEADGRVRTVRYLADATGFHADVKTNEPGVEAKDPADVAISKSKVVVVDPTITYTSPAAHTLAYALAPANYKYAPTVYRYGYASVPAVLGYSYTSGLPALGHYSYNLSGHHYNLGKHYVW